MKINMYIAIGENELFNIIKNIRIKEKKGNILLFFIGNKEICYLKRYIMETNIIDNVIFNEIDYEEDNKGYIDSKILSEIERYVIDYEVENIFYLEEAEESIYYSLQYIKKYIKTVNVEVLENYNDIYNEKLVSTSTRKIVDKYINDNFRKIDYIMYEYPVSIENQYDEKKVINILKLLSVLFEKKEILVICKSSKYKEKIIRVMKKIKKVRCVIVNSFESLLYLILRSYFVITDNLLTIKTAQDIKKEVILTKYKNAAEVIDDVRNISRIIELRKKYKESKNMKII